MQVSIIIPCHNSAETINRAVESIFSQTWKDWELILVNNNSMDNTLDILHQIKSSNPEKNIIVLDEKKKGAPAARNKGLYEAKGEWIQFLDADDALLPEKLEKQLEILKTTDTHVIYSTYFMVNKSEIFIDIDSGNHWLALLSSKAGITSANLFLKESVLSIKGWDESLSSSQEYDLMFRIAKKGYKFSPITECLTKVYFVQNSISNNLNSRKLKKRFWNNMKLRVQIYSYLQKQNITMPEYKDIYNQKVIDISFWYFQYVPFYAIFVFNLYYRDKLIKRLRLNTNFLKSFIKMKIA